MLSPSRQVLPAAQHGVAHLWYRAVLPVAPCNMAQHSSQDMRLCPIKALCAVDALYSGCHCLNKTEVCREILFPGSVRNCGQIQLCSGNRGFSSPAHRTVAAVPAPITHDCDLLVEQVVMATDDFCYGTSAFTFWAQFSLGNFQLKHLPVKLH